MNTGVITQTSESARTEGSARSELRKVHDCYYYDGNGKLKKKDL